MSERVDVVVVAGEVVPLETEGGRLRGVRPAGLGLLPVEVGRNGTVFGSMLPAGADGATSVPGVWVAGNAGDVRAQVIVAAAQGPVAAGQITMDLVMEETCAAVAARAGARAA